MLPACGIAGLLDVQAEVDWLIERLDVPLRLHTATHHTEGFPRLAILQREAGNDGLEGAFARCVDIGVAGFEGEHFAAVLKREAKAGDDDAAAHAAGVVRLDERDHVALGIGGAEVDRVAVAEGGVAGGIVGFGGAGADELGRSAA